MPSLLFISLLYFPFYSLPFLAGLASASSSSSSLVACPRPVRGRSQDTRQTKRQNRIGACCPVIMANGSCKNLCTFGCLYLCWKGAFVSHFTWFERFDGKFCLIYIVACCWSFIFLHPGRSATYSYNFLPLLLPSMCGQRNLFFCCMKKVDACWNDLSKNLPCSVQSPLPKSVLPEKVKAKKGFFIFSYLISPHFSASATWWLMVEL